eukprot:Rmarinus@m.6239
MSSAGVQLRNMLGNEQLNALRSYVTQDSSQNQAESTVRLHVTHSNLKAEFMDLRLDRHMKISTVKDKLKTHTGTNPDSMRLYLKQSNGAPVAELGDDSRMLGYFSPEDGMILHVVDTDPHSLSAHGGLEDLSLVKKYVMDDETYNKRDQTYRKFKEEKLAEDPTWTLEKEMKRRKDPNWEPPAPKDPEYGADMIVGWEVGNRCEVNPGGRRGTLRYIGKAEPLGPGYWVGVEYDEPVGKNNGTVKGEKFFECADKYGGMLRPEKLTVGDFPEIDEFADADGSEDEL